MKQKILIMISIIAFLINPLAFSGSPTYASGQDFPIYISRVYAKNGKEFIELFNDSSDNFHIETISIKNEKGLFFNENNLEIGAQDYLRISQENNSFSGNKINTKALLRGQQDFLAIKIKGS